MLTTEAYVFLTPVDLQSLADVGICWGGAGYRRRGRRSAVCGRDYCAMQLC